MTLILLLPGYKHDKHDTTHQNETHDTPSSPRYVYYHASFFTQHCRSDVITNSPSQFLQRHDRRCSSFEVCNPNCCCGLGSCCTFYQPSIHHFPTDTTHYLLPAHQHHYSWLDCFMLLVVVFLPRVIRHHSPHMHKKKNPMPPLSTT